MQWLMPSDKTVSKFIATTSILKQVVANAQPTPAAENKLRLPIGEQSGLHQRNRKRAWVVALNPGEDWLQRTFGNNSGVAKVFEKTVEVRVAHRVNYNRP